jgi:hypothetical protein
MWNSFTDDLTLKDGSVVKEYTIKFITTERKVNERIEKFFQGLMDELRMECHNCKWWNYSYGCQNKKGICDFESIADTPQTDCPKMTEEEFDTMLAKVLVGQTDSTGSPIGDYRDGVGAWQTDCGWGEPNE